MSTIRESVPAQWSETDERFFRVVAEVLPVAFLWGASELLASYDPELAPAALPTTPNSETASRADSAAASIL